MGKDLLRSHLEAAKEQRLPVRLIVATTAETAAVDAGADASELKKTFHVRPDVVGTVVTFDSDRFVIDFTKREV